MNLLKQSEQAKQTLFMLERGIDIEQMLRSIDGDVTFVLPSEPAAEGISNTDFVAMATVKNSDFLSDVADWQRSARDYDITLSQKGKNQYLLKAQDMQMEWGVDGETLYVATPNAVYTSMQYSRDVINGAKYPTFVSFLVAPIDILALIHTPISLPQESHL